jgi:hypothetical protein
MDKFYTKKLETIVLPTEQQQNASCGSSPGPLATNSTMMNDNTSNIGSSIKQKKSIIEELVEDVTKSSNGVKKASGFLSPIKNN